MTGALPGIPLLHAGSLANSLILLHQIVFAGAPRSDHLVQTRVYQEKASGAKSDRPEMMKLLDSARKGDVVVVWKLDRLARSIRQLIDTTAMLNERGVELHSLTENINTTTPSGKLTFHIFAALAEFERDILRQRVNAGLAAARRRGSVGGRPKALSEADLKKAQALLRSGDYTKTQVAKELA